VNGHQHGKILYWNLGIGSNTPTSIKLPFMQMTYKNPEATYATINLGEVFTVEQILTEHPDCSVKQVVFNVFKDIDWDIYQRLLL